MSNTLMTVTRAHLDHTRCCLTIGGGRFSTHGTSFVMLTGSRILTQTTPACCPENGAGDHSVKQAPSMVDPRQPSKFEPRAPPRVVSLTQRA